MITSWYERASQFKSPKHVVAAILLRSRESKRAEIERLKAEIDRRDAQLRQQEQELRRQQEQIRQQSREAEQLKQQLDAARASVNLPVDIPIGTHGYGARMIALAVNLARSIGIRGAARVLRLFMDWLGIRCKTPSRTSIRGWLQRLGIARVNEPLGENEDLVVMADHSNQIGAEKVLAVLAVRATTNLDAGEALQHKSVRVLEVKPGTQWKTADMQREFQGIADRYGVPRAIVTDGATELQEGAKCLENRRDHILILRDFKHYAANVLKSVIGKDKRFQEINGKIGTTRSAIQQTELGHLIPPSVRPKARFMNLSATILWMSLIAWLNQNPSAKSRNNISTERFEAKLGWVRDYVEEIAVWQECQDVVSRSLTFINEQQLHKGASQKLQSVIGERLQHAKSKEVARRLIEFVADSEQHVRDGERIPMSTEILESAFGLYKQLEGQQSKSGFTSLLACFPAMLSPTSPAEITAAFDRTSRADVSRWIQDRFPSTLTARRQAAYAEFKATTKRATLTPTTS